VASRPREAKYPSTRGVGRLKKMLDIYKFLICLANEISREHLRGTAVTVTRSWNSRRLETTVTRFERFAMFLLSAVTIAGEILFLWHETRGGTFSQRFLFLVYLRFSSGQCPPASATVIRRLRPRHEKHRHVEKSRNKNKERRTRYHGGGEGSRNVDRSTECYDDERKATVLPRLRKSGTAISHKNKTRPRSFAKRTSVILRVRAQ